MKHLSLNTWPTEISDDRTRWDWVVHEMNGEENGRLIGAGVTDNHDEAKRLADRVADRYAISQGCDVQRHWSERPFDEVIDHAIDAVARLDSEVGARLLIRARLASPLPWWLRWLDTFRTHAWSVETEEGSASGAHFTERASQRHMRAAIARLGK